MTNLQRINLLLDKSMPVITPASVVLGVALADLLGPYSFLSPWVFAFMTFAGSLGCSLRELGGVISRPLPIIATLAVLHLLMPLAAWGVGHLFYANAPETITGLVLAAAIPTGITSMLWVSIYRGHTALTLAIIVLDTLISPLLVPSILSLLVGAKVELDIFGMMKGLFLMIALPSLLAILLNQLTQGRVKALGPCLAPFSKIGVVIVVAINSAVIAPFVKQADERLVVMGAIVLSLMALGYVMGWGFGRMCKWGKETEVALTFNSGMRNTNAGMVLAVAFFPPPVALPVVFGIIFQQLLASCFGFFLHRQNISAVETTAHG